MPIFEGHVYHGQDAALSALVEEIHAMGEEMLAMLALTQKSIASPGAELFAQAKTIDKSINERDAEMERKVVSYISKYPAIGEDVRFVISVVKIAALVERAGDKIKNATKHLTRLGAPIPPALRPELLAAAEFVQNMAPLALAQIADYDAGRTARLVELGAKVQQAYRKVIVSLQTPSAAGGDEPSLVLIAKNFEQAADMLIEIMKICHQLHLGARYEKEHAQAAG